MSKVQNLTTENLDHHGDSANPKRHSIYPRDGSDGHSTMTTNPSMRRMSRVDHRPSVQYGRRMSQASRTSVTGSSLGHKNYGLYQMKLQNTYKLCPDANEKFKPGPVRDVIQEVLNEYLEGEKYNPTQCRNLTQMLTDHIKARVKDMGHNRYKYIVTVTIGEHCNQGLQVVSRCLWNKDTDNFAEAHVQKPNGLYAVASVFACYFE